MRSFNVGNTELMIMELLSLALPLIVLILPIFLVRKAVSSGIRDAMSSNGSPASQGTEPSASEALDRHYASGELAGEEYLTIRGDITRDEDA
jgi:uncharacterized membrane protein